jgi:hypothetical protein
MKPTVPKPQRCAIYTRKTGHADDAVLLTEKVKRFNRLLFRQTIREGGNWRNSAADHQALAGRKRRCDPTSTCDKPNSKPLDTPEKAELSALWWWGCFVRVIDSSTTNLAAAASRRHTSGRPGKAQP